MFQLIIHFNSYVISFYIKLYYLTIFLYHWVTFYPTGIFLSLLIIYYGCYSFFKLIIILRNQLTVVLEFFDERIVFSLIFNMHNALLPIASLLITCAQSYLKFYCVYDIQLLKKKLILCFILLTLFLIFV